MVLCAGRLILCRTKTSALCFVTSQAKLCNKFSTYSKRMAAVTFSTERGDCPGWLQGDKGKTTQGLVVVQEWWGMNDQIKEQAGDIGKRGNFITLVPDLYRGKVATDKETAGHYMGELDWQGAVKDIQGAAKYLLANGCTKVGVTGFCMGGALSLASAALVPEISASAPFYGIPSPQLCDLTTITIPVQAHFGEKDDIVGFSSKEDAEKLEKTMAGRKFELIMHPGVGHAFTNPSGPLGNYNEEESEKALNAMVKFMKENLA